MMKLVQTQDNKFSVLVDVTDVVDYIAQQLVRGQKAWGGMASVFGNPDGTYSVSHVGEDHETEIIVCKGALDAAWTYLRATHGSAQVTFERDVDIIGPSPERAS